MVVITGVNGFLGSHVCLKFLKTNRYRVRGTVKLITDTKKVQSIKKACGEYFD